MTRFEDKSINQLLLQFVSPLLIILMVGSLVFFFIEVIYRGPHTARLYWVMGLFTIAAVLVSRISIEEGRERAQLFGLALAAATMVTSLQLVKFSYGGMAFLGPVVVLVLIAIVMWTSSKLTWDCTVVDRSRDASSMGLLEIFKRRLSGEPAETKIEGSESEQSGIIASVSRLLFAARKNTPGIWVFYFAMIAFPVFGFGQWFVRQESQGWIFVLFAGYLGATLGLLMTTSLLGLERYLAKRNLHVPGPIVRNWLMVGGSFALLVVLAVTLIPKPASVSSIENFAAIFDSPIRDSVDFAPGKDGQKDDPEAKKQRLDDNAEKTKEGNNGDGDSGGDDGKGDGGKGSDGEEGSDSKDNQQSESSNKKQDAKDSSDEKVNEPRKKEASDPEEGNERNTEKNDAANNQQAQHREAEQQQANRKHADQQHNQKQGQTNGSKNSNPIRNLMENLSKGVRWITWILGAGAVLVLVWMFRTDLANLFKKRNREDESDLQPPTKSAKPLRRFTAFQDPFASGKAQAMSAQQLAQYSMLALEAWGREFEHDNDTEMTPIEFARSLAAIDDKLSTYAIELADLYNQCAFSNERVGRVNQKPLVNLWRRMIKTFNQSNSRNRAASAAE